MIHPEDPPYHAIQAAAGCLERILRELQRFQRTGGAAPLDAAARCQAETSALRSRRAAAFSASCDFAGRIEALERLLGLLFRFKPRLPSPDAEAAECSGCGEALPDLPAYVDAEGRLHVQRFCGACFRRAFDALEAFRDGLGREGF